MKRNPYVGRNARQSNPSALFNTQLLGEGSEGVSDHALAYCAGA